MIRKFIHKVLNRFGFIHATQLDWQRHVTKHLDEFRETIEYIETHSPDILDDEKHFCFIGWLDFHDAYLSHIFKLRFGFDTDDLVPGRTRFGYLRDKPRTLETRGLGKQLK